MNMVHILGGAQTDFERNWTKEGKNLVAILKEVVHDGFEESDFSFEELGSLSKKDAIGCFIGNFIAEKYINQGHIGSFLTEVDDSFYGVPSARYEAACASGSVALDAAIMSIESGRYDVAIVVGIELMKSVNSRVCGDILGCAADYEKEVTKDSVQPPFPQLFGKLADAILEKYPALESKRFMDSLAMISVKNYANAKRNPMAQTRKWYMDFEQASCRGSSTNPLVGGRLAVSDCSQITDGAALVVLCSDRFAKKRCLPVDIVVKGWGHRTAPLLFDSKISDNAGSQYVLPWTRQTILDAYRRSGLSLYDIDVFETHDCFTSSEYAAISAFGITPPGKEYEAIESGVVAFGGSKPINPSGGLIGCGHPVGATGVRMFLDLFKQVSGVAGGYQVDNAKNAMMLNIGGSATSNYAFIVGRNMF